MGRQTDFTRTVDIVLGQRIANFRIAKGWSRMQLAAKIGVTHQQLAKYEKGVNRITIGRLLIVADVLNETVENLCGKIMEDTRPESPARRLGIELSRNFTLIEDAKQQVALVALCRAMIPNKLQVVV